MNSRPYLRALEILFRLIIAGIFLYNGLAKITELQDFAQSIYNYDVFPVFLTGIAAVFMPVFEIVLGLFILLGICYRTTSILLLMVTSAFIVLLSQALIRGLDISCGCSGAGAGNLWHTLIQDIFIVGMLIFLLKRKKPFLVLDSLFSRKCSE